VELVWPSLDRLPRYVAALETGWSQDNVRGAAAAVEELAKIRADAAAFVDSLVDREGRGEPISLPDGSKVARLPGFRMWMWDGDICGAIGLRWQAGTEDLPPYCLGHIGYSVLPAHRRRGHATQALRDILPYARAEGLRYVEITTDPTNVASQRVIEANGGVLHEHFVKPTQFGAAPGLRYRISLA